MFSKSRAEVFFNRLFTYAESRLTAFALIMFFLSFFLGAAFTNFHSLLKADSYLYMLKAIEITKGNFLPISSHSFGLSIAAAPFFLLFGAKSVIYNMWLAKWASIFFSSAVIFPFFLLARSLLKPRGVITALFMFAFYPSIATSSGAFLSEPLFTFFFLFSLYFMTASLKKPRLAVLSFAFGGLSYYVRPTGLFAFAILSVSFFIMHLPSIRKKWKHLAFGILVFWLVSLPFLYGRFEAFGSPFTYGVNDKLWVENYDMVWAPNTQPPSFLEYLATHSPSQLFDRFVIHGFARAMLDFIHPLEPFQYSPILSPVLMLFFFHGFFLALPEKKFWPMHLSFAVFISALTLIYAIFGTPRHFIPLVPLIIIFSVKGFHDIIKKHEMKSTLSALLILVFILFSIPAMAAVRMQDRTEMPAFASWTAHNIQGKIGLIKGASFILMNFPDASTNNSAPESNVTLEPLGYFGSIEEAIPYFEKRGINYVIVNKKFISRRPYLKEIYLPKYNSYFSKVYSDSEADIFRFNPRTSPVRNRSP